MAETSAIEWTDATWNPITGCSLKSSGCRRCYAMALAGTRLKNLPSRRGLTIDTKAGPVWTGEVRFNDGWLTQPLQWGRPRRIFVCAHGDLFHEDVPDDWIAAVFGAMALAPHHTFQVLTKRPGRMRELIPRLSPAECLAGFYLARPDAAAVWPLDVERAFGVGLRGWPLPNVWLGTSAEDQRRADERVPELLATPAVLRFLSAEPLLGPMSLEEAWYGETALDAECWGDCRWCEKGFPPLHNCRHGRGDSERTRSGLDWVIVGGESGPGARPMHTTWARSLRDQCAAADVPFLFKQWGAWFPDGDLDDGGERFRLVGKKAAGRLLDGVEHNTMPEARRA